jgi:hypothetical protein
MLQNMEVICKHLVEWRMLKQFSICQMPETETDEQFLWTSTTTPAEKAKPFCQGSLAETVDCKSEFSFGLMVPRKCNQNVHMCTLPWAQRPSSLVADGPWGWAQIVYMLWTKVPFYKIHMCTVFRTFPSWVRNFPKENNPHFNCLGK